MKSNGILPWIKDERDPALRSWEEFYRNRWQHDKVVRSTHGVNCTGGCTWQIYVKDGIVTWEMQGLDYPLLEAGLPPYEPRGCQRGISYSWYLYSPLRVKYPYVRGVLLDLWKAARAHARGSGRSVEVDGGESRGARRWQRARGKGGFRRVDWDSMRRTDRRFERLHHPEVRAGPHCRILAHSRDVDDQLRQRRAHAATDGRRRRCRSTTGIATCRRPRPKPGASRRTWRNRPTGTTPSCSRWWAPTSRMTRTPDCPLRRRSAPQRIEDVGLLAGLQPGFEVRRRVDRDQRRTGRRLVDGGEPRPAERVSSRNRRRRTSSITRRNTPTRRTWSRSPRRTEHGRPGKCCAPIVCPATQTSRTATGSSSCGTRKRTVRRCRWAAPVFAGASKRASGICCCAIRSDGSDIHPASHVSRAHDEVSDGATRQLRRRDARTSAAFRSRRSGLQTAKPSWSRPSTIC